MKRLFSLLLLFACCISCQSNSAQSTQNLEAGEYKNRLENNKDIQLVDVRTPKEFESGHLTNASNIDYNAAGFEQKILSLDKTKPVYLYCLSGGRSSSALTFLLKNGYPEVYNLKGGIMEWKANHFPIENKGSVPAVTAWTGMSKETYEQYTRGSIPVLFDFKAKWCGPCKQLEPILRDLEREYPDKIKVVAIDIDENKSLADELKIRSIPFLIFYKDGKHNMNIDGLTDKKNLINALGLKK